MLSRALKIASAHDAALSIVHVIDIPGPSDELLLNSDLQAQAAVASGATDRDLK